MCSSDLIQNLILPARIRLVLILETADRIICHFASHLSFRIFIRYGNILLLITDQLVVADHTDTVCARL